jgi:hypothetical protein
VVAAAIMAWRAIIEWNEARDCTLRAAWPRQELERLSGA